MTGHTAFSELKKNRKSNFDKLSEELSKAAGGKVDYKKEDERFWYPAVDKVGNGFAVIRFLPAPKGEDVPFVRLFEHGFQGPTGSWYIENSLTTLGLPDPVSEYNSKLWNAGAYDESPERKQARKQKRKLNFYSNIYVVEDPANPENEGKVFLFRYGKKIFNKLYAANNPEFKDEKKIDPFDLWEGANLKIKIRQVEGFRNYDSSSFMASAPLFADDGRMEKIWKQEHSLQEIVDAKNFKSYDELKTKLYKVLGLGTVPGPGGELPPSSKVKTSPVSKSRDPELLNELETEVDDDELNFFKNLAEDGEDLIA